MKERGGSYPGGSCGFWGCCGAAASVGMCMSILTKSLQQKRTSVCILIIRTNVPSVKCYFLLILGISSICRPFSGCAVIRARPPDALLILFRIAASDRVGRLQADPEMFLEQLCRHLHCRKYKQMFFFVAGEGGVQYEDPRSDVCI